jgi:amidase
MGDDREQARDAHGGAQLQLHEYAQQDAVGLHDLMRTGAVTAAEVQLVARQALEVANAELNGLAMPLFSAALEHAAEGPLGGVPFLIKDVPMARGVPFCIGSGAGHAGRDNRARNGDQFLH